MTQPKINSQFIKTNIHPDSASLKAFGEAIETFNTNLLAVAPVNAVAASKDFTSFKLTAKTKGLVGNNISLTVVAPEDTAELSIQVNGYEIVVTAAHDGTDVTTTGSDLVTALNAHAQAKLLAKTLDQATGQLLDNDKSPSRRTGELDNRGSHFYLAKFWAEALAAQDEDAELKAKFAPLAKALAENEDKIVAELAAVQGKAADIGGYYAVDPAKVNAVMRPSATLNAALETV